jgi:hypothetical protein
MDGDAAWICLIRGTSVDAVSETEASRFSSIKVVPRAAR